MTDLEVDKRLALAIGWKINHVTASGEVHIFIRRGISRKFDYKDWAVIGPIAERYRCFPQRMGGEWYSRCGDRIAVFADTPQKAIALAVIGAKK
jgi:hypothetical protein